MSTQDTVQQGRKRVAAIMECAFPGQEALVQKLIEDGTDPLDAITQLNEAYRRTPEGQRGIARAEAATGKSGMDLYRSAFQMYLREGKDEQTAHRMACANVSPFLTAEESAKLANGPEQAFTSGANGQRIEQFYQDYLRQGKDPETARRMARVAAEGI